MQSLAVIIFLSCLPSMLIDFALPQWKKDRQFQIEDAYKWIYQATRGGEHAIPDKEMARQYLEGEWQKLGKPEPNEQIWEPLCSDGEIGRLNLRPFRVGGGQANDLLDAFVQSSQDFKNDESNFIAAWNELGKRLKSKSSGNLNGRAWSKLNQKMKAENYPAIHHSQIFEQSRHPAYRILTKENAHKLIEQLK